MRRSMGSRSSSSRSMGSRSTRSRSMGSRGSSRSGGVNVHIGGRPHRGGYRRRGYGGGYRTRVGNPLVGFIATLIVGILLIVFAFTAQPSVYYINNGVDLSYTVTETVNAEDSAFNDYRFDVSGSITNTSDQGTDEMYLLVFVKEDNMFKEYEFTFEVYANETFRLSAGIDVEKLKKLEVLDAMVYGLDDNANIILDLDASATNTQGSFVQSNVSEIGKLSYNLTMLIIGIVFASVAGLILIAVIKAAKTQPAEAETQAEPVKSTSVTEQTAQSEKTWQCSYCGVVNRSTKTKCEGCGAKRSK